MYQVVKKCEKDTRILGRELLEDYKSLINGDKHGDEAKTIARLRTKLFLDLSIGGEFEFFVHGQGVLKEHDLPAKLRLEWWVRINDQFANFRVRDTVRADLDEKRWLTVNITREIISTLASQGIFFHGKTFNSFQFAEQSRHQASPPAKRLSSRQKGVIERKPTKNLGKDKRKHRLKACRKRKSGQGKVPFRTKPHNDKTMFESDKRNEDGSGSGNDMERIPTPEIDEIVASIRSEIHTVTPGEKAEDVGMGKGEI